MTEGGAEEHPAGPDVLRRRRTDAGYTQEELAGLSGLSARTIRNLESGRTPHPRLSSLDDLALALGMSGTEWEAFKDSWGMPGRGVRLDLQKVMKKDGNALFLAQFREQVDAFTTTYNSMHSFVGPGRRVVHEERERLVTANVGGLRTLLMGVSTSSLSPTGTTTASALSSCRIGRKTSIPGEQMDMYEVHLGRELRKGEAWHCAVAVDYHGAPTDEPADAAEVNLAMWVIYHVDSLALFKVTFDPDDPPTRCWSAYEESLGSGLVDGPDVLVSGGEAQLVVRQPLLGWHGLRWEW